jgi:DNA-binding transcriptional ArsR family regulator
VTVRLDRTLGALADPTRRGVIDLLRRGPYRASDLAEALDASRPAMSRHLRVLRTSGLVEPVAPATPGDARERVYRLRADRLAELRDWLDEALAFWTDQLGAFAAHVERTRGTRRPAARRSRG